MPLARPRLLALRRIPPPPLLAPRLALPPPVSLMPRFPPDERVPDAEREPAPERMLEFPLVVRPAVSSITERSPDRMLSVHSPIWSLRLLSWLLIWLRFD